MRTFNFYDKNEPIFIALSANTFEEAEIILFETVKSNYGWRVEDIDGEIEEPFNED
jgi:hypothetical protein